MTIYGSFSPLLLRYQNGYGLDSPTHSLYEEKCDWDPFPSQHSCTWYKPWSNYSFTQLKLTETRLIFALKIYDGWRRYSEHTYEVKRGEVHKAVLSRYINVVFRWPVSKMEIVFLYNFGVFMYFLFGKSGLLMLLCTD